MTGIVVVDLDPGIDDIYALIMLVNADSVGLITLAAIICSFGNVILEHSCKNVIIILEVMKRTDIPVYQGVNNTLIVPQYFDHYFGVDGFGNIGHKWKPDLSVLKRGGATDAVYEIATKHPGRVTLVTLGPLTFATIVLMLHEDLPLKDIWIMGGNSTEFKKPEFNFRKDPEAAYGVLLRIHVPAYIHTFDASKLTTTNVGWRKKVLGKIKNNLMSVMNQVEAFKLDKKSDKDKWIQHDAILVGALLHKNVSKTMSKHCGTVTLTNCDPDTAGGYLLLDSKCKKKNVILVEDIDSEAYQDALYKAASGGSFSLNKKIVQRYYLFIYLLFYLSTIIRH